MKPHAKIEKLTWADKTFPTFFTTSYLGRGPLDLLGGRSSLGATSKRAMLSSLGRCFEDIEATSNDRAEARVELAERVAREEAREDEDDRVPDVLERCILPVQIKVQTLEGWDPGPRAWGRCRLLVRRPR